MPICLSVSQPLRLRYEADAATPGKQGANRFQDSIDHGLVVAGDQYQAVAGIAGQFVRPALTAIPRAPHFGNQGEARGTRLPQQFGEGLRHGSLNYDLDTLAGLHSNHLVSAW